VVAGAGGFGLLVDGVQAKAEQDGNQRQNAHGDAQALNGRSQIGEGAGGEIEGNSHS